jgi:hypothetical protein|tara:strand:- start:185 stop:685 length:501 start_codon:yes stop_codon:yes gene_type:complete
MAEALLVTRKDIVKFTAMSGNVDTDKFIQYIKIAQDKHIENYLGSDLIDKIKQHIIDDDLAGDYLTLVNEWVKPCLIHWAMVEYLPFAAYSIANKGVFKHSSENAENASRDEVDYLLEKERNTAQYYTDRLIDHLSFNAGSKYPEYYTNNNEDVSPDKDLFGGWVL